MNKIFSSNVAVRILSVLIALTIWVVASEQSNKQVASNEMSKNFYRIPIEVLNVPANYAISYDYTAVESIVLKGSSSLLTDMLGQEITASIDLKGLSEGEYDLEINLRYPAGLSIEAVQPHKVHVSLVSSMSRVMDVEVIITEQPADAAVDPVVTIQPETVLVVGSRSTLEQVAQAVVLVDLSERRGNFEQSMEVKILDSAGNSVEGVSLQPSLVAVTIQLLPAKDIGLVLPDSLAIPEGWVLQNYTFSPTTVRINGDLEQLALIETLPVKMSVPDLTAEDKASEEIVKSLRTTIQLPEGITLAQEMPNTVRVTLTLKRVSGGTTGISAGGTGN
ncbi:MAG: hypothetical protein LLG09_06555 [Negativicutes bacterium]|nr:hypothetical protein [Negativicutes bacterium]